MTRPHPAALKDQLADERAHAHVGLPGETRGLSRNYTVDLRLLGLSDETPGARLLDVGCGAGRHEFAAAELPVRAVAMDLSMRELRDGRFFVGEAATERNSGLVEWVQADAARLPFPGGAFDALMCSETLEHVDDDLAALRELRRVARPGAALAVSVPAYWPELALWLMSWRITHTAGGHVRIYRERDIVGKLRATGWRPYARRRRHALETVYWLLGAACGGGDPPAWPARRWRKFVTAPEKAESRLFGGLERLADPWLAKSIVVYARAV